MTKEQLILTEEIDYNLKRIKDILYKMTAYNHSNNIIELITLINKIFATTEEAISLIDKWSKDTISH